MRKLELENTALEALRRGLRDCLHASPEARLACRIACLLLVAQGLGCAEVARRFGKTPRSLERWIHAFRESGVKGLREETRPGRPSEFGGECRERIRAILRRDPREFGYAAKSWSGPLLARHLRKFLGVGMSERQGLRLFRELRENPPKPRCVPVNPARDATFISSAEKNPPGP